MHFFEIETLSDYDSIKICMNDFKNHPLRFHHMAYLIQIGNRCIHLYQHTSFHRLSRGSYSTIVPRMYKYISLTFITFIAITFISIYTILFIFFIPFYCWSNTSILLILSFSVNTISITVTGMSLVAAFVLSKKSNDIKQLDLILNDPIPYHDIVRYLALCRYYKHSNNFRLYFCNADYDHKCMAGQKFRMLLQESMLLSIRQYLHT